MKWPFTRTEKDALKETTRLVATPPRPRPASNLGVPEDLRKTQALTVKDTIPAVELQSETLIPVRFESVRSQVSPKLFTSESETDLAELTIQIPAGLIVPQLTSGRIKVDWVDLVPLIPTNLLRHPAPPGVDQPAVILPMGEIVAAIPPEAFTVRGDAPANLNSEEFEDLPQLFDDAFFREQSSAPAPTAPAVPAAEPPPPPPPAPVSQAVKPVQKHWASTESIFVKLRNLVAGMPDAVFACPRSELWQKADPNIEIALPIAPLMSKLGSARLTLPLATVISALPPDLFVSPLPDLEGQEVALPLHEVVRQLPPSLFSIQGKDKTEPTAEALDTDISDPFREKTPAAATAAIEPPPTAEPIAAAAESPAPIAETAPAPAVTVQPEPAPVDDAMLADDNFAIFAETPAAADPVEPAPPLSETQPVSLPAEPVVEPLVAETTPAMESVAATPPEPVPQPANDFLINLNRCSFEELQQVDGVGPALAKRIVDYRAAHGQFRSVYELRNVPGVGRKTFQALAGVPLRRLNRLLGIEHDQELSLTEIARLICAIPGVDGCVLVSAEGLPLTGHLPPSFDQERFSVFAPQLFKRVSRYTRELSVGNVNHLTVFTEEQPVSIYRAGTIYLVVVHHPDRFSKALLRRCGNISTELARLCRQRVGL